MTLNNRKVTLDINKSFWAIAMFISGAIKSDSTLSDKRKELMTIMLKERPTPGRIYRIIKKQDNEFIKELKKELAKPEYFDCCDQVIDKLAGKAE